MLDSLSDTGAIDKVLSDEEGLSYFKLMGQVFTIMTRYSMTRQYESTRIYDSKIVKNRVGGNNEKA